MDQCAALTGYEWHSDATRDPFAKLLNKAMGGGAGGGS
jgi:hypothetical protein